MSKRRKPPARPIDLESFAVFAARAGNHRAAQHLVDRTLPIRIKIARQYLRPGLPMEDLLAATLVGLAVALDRYQSWRRTDLLFSTYCYWHIRKEVQRAVGELRYQSHEDSVDVAELPMQLEAPAVDYELREWIRQHEQIIKEEIGEPSESVRGDPDPRWVAPGPGSTPCQMCLWPRPASERQDRADDVEGETEEAGRRGE